MSRDILREISHVLVGGIPQLEINQNLYLDYNRTSGITAINTGNFSPPP